ncbi:hypothetical protein D3C86_1316170 [compost metagenome]
MMNSRKPSTRNFWARSSQSSQRGGTHSPGNRRVRSRCSHSPTSPSGQNQAQNARPSSRAERQSTSTVMVAAGWWGSTSPCPSQARSPSPPAMGRKPSTTSGRTSQGVSPCPSCQIWMPYCTVTSPQQSSSSWRVQARSDWLLIPPRAGSGRYLCHRARGTTTSPNPSQSRLSATSNQSMSSRPRARRHCQPDRACHASSTR